MRIAVAPLVLAFLALPCALLPDVLAGEGAQIHFDDTLQRTVEGVETANQRVRDALAAQDFNAWNQAHDAYIQVLVRAVPEIERTIATYLLGTLEGGGQLDRAVLDAVAEAAEAAALFAKQRVVTGAYATLTRRGVRPDSRGAALKLLEKQGVYALDGRDPGADRPAPMQGLGESPMAGRVPTTPEAAKHLSRWQYAYMSAEAMGPRIVAYETQIEGLPADAPNRGDVLARLDQARVEYQQLLTAIVDYRRKYYESGGK
jgi:hypothetical protein